MTWLAAVVTCVSLLLSWGDTPIAERATSRVRHGSVSSTGLQLCVHVVQQPSLQQVSGATVRAFHEQPERRYVAVGEERTASSGRVCLRDLPPGRLWLVAEAPGLARASTELLLQAARTLEMQLAPARELRVTITDELGAPLPRATLLVSGADRLPFGALSDASGVVRLTRLPAPPWSVRVAAPGYEATTRPEVSADLQVALRRLSSLRVRVVDGSGSAVQGASVMIAGANLWPARQATTDAGGAARIAGLSPGSYDLRAVQAQRVSPTYFGFEVSRGSDQELTLHIATGRMITARVTDGAAADARPVAEADVVLVEGGLSSFPYRGRSGKDGKVTLGPIAVGPATLGARADAFVGSPLVAVPLEPDGPVTIPLLRGGALRGQVVDARGFPVEGATIEVVGTDSYGLPIAESPGVSQFRANHFAWSLAFSPALIPAGELGVMPGPVPTIPPAGLRTAPQVPSQPALEATAPESAPWVTRSDGQFEAKPVTPGRVRVLVRHPEYVEGASSFVTLTPGGDASVRVVLLKGGAVDGRVVDARGFPVAGADITLFAERGALEHRSFTASDGSFAFAAVPAEVTISVARPGHVGRVAVQQTLRVPESARLQVELTVPEQRGPVRFVIRDADQRPVELAEIRALSLELGVPLRSTLFTDAGGAAELPDAAGLPLKVSVDAPSFALYERTLDAAPAEVQVELDPGVTLVGRVTAVRGRFAAANARVALRSGAQRKHTLSDAEGEFRFTGVAVGRAELSVQHPDYAAATAHIEVERSTRHDRPLELAPIDLADAGSVEGEVVDSEGRAVEGARVAPGVVPAYLPAGSLPPGMTLTDASGRFLLAGLPAGRVRLGALLARIGRGNADEIMVEAGRTTRGIRIRLTEPADNDESLATGGVAITLSEGDSSTAPELLVAQVASGSQAERGGLLVGDRLLNVDGHPPRSLREARERLTGRAGTDVLLEVARDGARLRLQLQREAVRQ